MTPLRLMMFSWFLACLCLGGSRSAWAQTPPALLPPQVKGSTDVPYPVGEEGDASVILNVLVEKDGSVAEVEVVEGAEPFAEHARKSVLAWHFVPAMRGDVAVAAKIRARVAFHRSASLPPSSMTSASPVPAVKPASPEDLTPPTGERPRDAETAPQEVIARGNRREIGETTLSAADVREMPGAFGDPFRAVEALPGVVPVMSGVPYFFIRGAPPNNNGYFLDGIRVPLLFHVGLGPGVIHPALLDRVNFYSGAAPASLGGFAGAIIAGQTRPPRAAAHGEASVRLVDAGALVESPFASDRGSVLVAGRYGFPGPILSAFSDIRVGYWDYQSRLTWRAGDRDTLSLLAFGSHDFLGRRTQSGAIEETLVSDFHRADLRYDHALIDGRVRTAVTLGYDFQGSNPSYLINRSAALRVEIEKQLGPALRVRGGADARIDSYRIRRDERVNQDDAEVPSSADPPPTNLTAGAHADLVWRVGRVEVVPGIRFTIFDSTRARSQADTTRVRTTVPAFDPLLSTRVVLGGPVAWLVNLGVSQQYQVLRLGSLPAPVVAGAGFAVGESHLQKTLRMSQGIEVGLLAEVTLTATGFVSRSWGLTDLTASCLQVQPPSSPRESPRDVSYHCPSNAPVRGSAYGFELLVRRSLSERLSGWLSYTLSRSIRTSHFITLDGGDAVATVPSEFDRTHMLNAVLAYDLGRSWRAGARVVLYSGAPYSALAGDVPVPPYNAYRDPLFFRLDVRLEKRWVFGQGRSIAFVLEGQNVTLSKEANTLGQDCRGEMTGDTSTTQCIRADVGPITIPSVGVEATF